MANKRFERVHSDGPFSGARIYVDTVTGVNYLFIAESEAGGLTPLLDKEGKPIIMPYYNNMQ